MYEVRVGDEILYEKNVSDCGKTAKERIKAGYLEAERLEVGPPVQINGDAI